MTDESGQFAASSNDSPRRRRVLKSLGAMAAASGALAAGISSPARGASRPGERADVVERALLAVVPRQGEHDHHVAPRRAETHGRPLHGEQLSGDAVLVVGGLVVDRPSGAGRNRGDDRDRPGTELTVPHGAALHAAEVRAGIRLAHGETLDPVAGDGGQQMPLDLLAAAGPQDVRRPGHHPDHRADVHGA